MRATLLVVLLAAGCGEGGVAAPGDAGAEVGPDAQRPDRPACPAGVYADGALCWSDTLPVLHDVVTGLPCANTCSRTGMVPVLTFFCEGWDQNQGTRVVCIDSRQSSCREAKEGGAAVCQ